MSPLYSLVRCCLLAWTAGFHPLSYSSSLYRCSLWTTLHFYSWSFKYIPSWFLIIIFSILRYIPALDHVNTASIQSAGKYISSIYTISNLSTEQSQPIQTNGTPLPPIPPPISVSNNNLSWYSLNCAVAQENYCFLVCIQRFNYKC